MNKHKLTLDMLKGRGSRELFRGEIEDSQYGFHINGTNKLLKYVVMKGHIDDWCIYSESCWEDMDYDKVKSLGDKIFIETSKAVIDASDEVFSRYRE